MVDDTHMRIRTVVTLDLLSEHMDLIPSCCASMEQSATSTTFAGSVAEHLQAGTSSSSRMRVIYHNWSATKQRPHPQSVAKISHHSVLSGDRIRQCETSSGSRHKDTDQCL